MPRGLFKLPTNKISFEDAEQVLDLTDGPNQEGWYHGHCPVHGDEHPSLGVLETEDGGIALYCHAGCESKDIYAAIRDLLNED